MQCRRETAMHYQIADNSNTRTGTNSRYHCPETTSFLENPEIVIDLLLASTVCNFCLQLTGTYNAMALSLNGYHKLVPVSFLQTLPSLIIGIIMITQD